MNSCDDEARRVIKPNRSITAESNMVNFGKWSVSVNDRVIDKLVREAVN